MSTPINIATYPDIQQDLDIIARALPGKGPALGRLIQKAGVMQKDIADHLKVDRSAVSQWLTEKKWPKPRRLLDTLIFLQIDRKLLAEAATILMGGDMVQDVFRACGSWSLLEVTREQMLEMLSSKGDFEQRDLIFKTFTSHVTLAVALKAAGMKGAESCDPKAAKLFFDEWREHQREATNQRTKRDQSPGAQRIIGAALQAAEVGRPEIGNPDDEPKSTLSSLNSFNS